MGFLRATRDLAARIRSERRLLAAARAKCAAGSERARSPYAGCAGLTWSAGSWGITGRHPWSHAGHQATWHAAGHRAGSGIEHELPQLILLLVLVELDAGTGMGTRDPGDRTDLIAAGRCRSRVADLARRGQ